LSRVYNFSAGPAVIPEQVLRQAQEELLDWRGTGMSVMEMSHRGKHFTEIAHTAERDFRDLLAIADNYKVLFLQGGGMGEFALVPMNLLRGKINADYINTGHWSARAIAEARKYCEVNVAASGEEENFTRIPPQASWKLSRDAAYVHYCSNETIGGVEFGWTPETGEVPLVADASSHILSRALNVSKFGLIYAGAQKNIGPAGLVIVIVREDLLGGAMSVTPSVFDYTQQSKAGWMLNTPSTFAVYLAGLTFKWLKSRGGLEAIEQLNAAKAKLLYDYIDASGFYSNPVAKSDRSRMNVPFRLHDDALDGAFLKEAEAGGLASLKGHRSVGGMRASIYNAMPVEGVRALIDFMRQFVKRYG
jgi:phosphoserine aminotransferase